MLSENKWQQYGFLRDLSDINCIVLHNTNDYKNSAQELFNYLENDCKTSQGTHFLIDHEKIIQVMPFNYGVYSTGKGNDYSSKHAIAIEICSNLNNDLYLQGQQKAITKIKALMKKFNIKTSSIYFHNDFDNRTYCPATILDLYGNKKNFIDKFFGGNK